MVCKHDLREKSYDRTTSLKLIFDILRSASFKLAENVNQLNHNTKSLMTLACLVRYKPIFLLPSRQPAQRGSAQRKTVCRQWGRV